MFSFLFLNLALVANPVPPNDCRHHIEQFDVNSGLGYRGFLGPEPTRTFDTEIAVMEKGIFWWNQRVFIKPSLEEAAQHDAGDSNPLRKGFYFIGENPTDLSAGSGLWMFGAFSQAQKLPEDLVRARFSLAACSLGETDAHGKYLVMPGWCFPNVRGVIHFQDILVKNSSTYRKLRNSARNLIASGGKVTINHAFEAGLQELAKQQRKGQSPANNVYARPETQAFMREAYRRGLAFMVEVWNPAGKLVGGSLGMVTGNIVSGQTMFYDHVDYGKIATMATTDLGLRMGSHWLDVQMVTNATRDLKARQITKEAFKRLMALQPDLHPERINDHHRTWHPDEAIYTLSTADYSQDADYRIIRENEIPLAPQAPPPPLAK